MAVWTTIVENAILTLGFSMLIGSMILPMAYKNLLSMLVNWAMSPLTSHAPFYIVILAVACIITTFSTVVQKYKIDGSLMRRLNEKNIAFQKRLKEAQLSGNKELLRKLEIERAPLLQEQSKLTIQQLRSTGYTVLVSIPLLMWVNWYLGNNPMTINLPLLGVHAYTEMLLIIPYWCILLSICSIVVGYVVRKAINPSIS